MALLKLNPFINSDDFFPEGTTDNLSSFFRGDDSSSDVVDNDREIRFSVDVPGIKASDLDLTVVEDGVIRIVGTRRKVSGADGKTVKKFRFVRSFKTDPQTVDLAQLKANLSDGVLVVQAPKKPKPEPKKITITTEPHKEIEAPTKDKTVDNKEGKHDEESK